jgi:hypothetical protein
MAAQTGNNLTSQAQFGLCANALGWPNTELTLQNDEDVLALVNEVVNRQSNDFLGISAVDVDCDQAPETMYHALVDIAANALEEAGQIGARWVHPSGGTFEATVRIIGFSFGLTMEGGAAKWTGTIRTAQGS